MSKYMLVIPTLSNGGAERVASTLSGALSKLGQEVCILKYYTAEGEYSVNEKVKIKNFVNDESEYKKQSAIKRILFIRKTIREEKPDFVIPFLYHVILAVKIAVVGLKVNVFPTVNNNPAVSPPKKFDRKIMDRIINKSKCSFVQNADQKFYYNKKIHPKIHILFNPISDVFFEIQHTKTEKEFVFCAVGRLTEQKNFELLIYSFIKAFDKEQKVKLIIYGEGHLREKLQKIINLEGYSTKILLAGRIKNMIDAYSTADAFVLSSDFEGLPNALIEAMASGLPSIATNCPTGPSVLIDDGKNGILVPVRDEIAISEAMRKIFENKELRHNFSLAGREKIKEMCSAEKIAKQMIVFCEQYK